MHAPTIIITLSMNVSFLNWYPDIPLEKHIIPKMVLAKVDNTGIIPPIISRPGWVMNIKGMQSAGRASLNAVIPVRNGSAPEIPEAA